MAAVVVLGPTINAGASISGAVDCTSGTIIRIFVPPEWTLAPLSFVLSPDNILPYATVCHADGRERVLNVQPNSMVLGSIVVGGWLKFRSGTSALLIPQKQTCQFRVTLIP
jgi:hypothetical protein